MAALAELKAPAGVDRDTLYRKVVSNERKQDKDKAEDSRMMSKMFTGGSAIVTALGGGFLFGKFPQIATIGKTGKVQTRALLAAPALVGAMLTKDWPSDVLEGVAYGFGLPFLHDWGTNLAQG